MTLTNDFCDEFYSECSAQLGLPSTYCDFHTGPQDGDAFYAYPYVPDGERENRQEEESISLHTTLVHRMFAIGFQRTVCSAETDVRWTARVV